MYEVNRNGALVLNKDGFLTLVVTEQILAEFDSMAPFMPESNHEEVSVWKAINVLAKYFPEAFEPDIILDKNQIKKWALINVVEASTHLSDRYFIARVWMMTAESLLNRPVNRFNLRFPYIEGNEP